MVRLDCRPAKALIRGKLGKEDNRDTIAAPRAAEFISGRSCSPTPGARHTYVMMKHF